MNSSRNLAARAGRWSAAHRKTAILGWIALVVAATMIGSAIGTETLTDAEYGVGESGEADKALAAAFPEESSEAVLVQSEGRAATDPEFRAVVEEVSRELRGIEGVKALEDPYAPSSEGGISEDGRSALINFELPREEDAAAEAAEATLAAVEDVQDANPSFFVGQFGEASADEQIGGAFEEDFQRAEFTSLPITLIILVLAFGALVAAGIPLLLGATSVAVALGLMAPLSQLWPVDEAASSVILLIGLAVGVDYTMFYLRREREERAAGRGPRAALEAAAATSGRAVLVSGITVLIAMSGMYLAGAATFTSFATGTMLVVAIAVLGSLTVLPAVLAALGDRVNKGRIPFLTPPQERAGREPRLWSRILDPVLRHPLAAALASGAVLVALAIPTLNITLAVPGVDSLPRDLSTVQTYDRIQESYPGEAIPADIVVEADDVRSPEVEAALDELGSEVEARPELFAQPLAVDKVSDDGTVALVAAPVAGDGTDETSKEALAVLREELIPGTLGAVGGVEANVTGLTAGTEDFNDLMAERVPIVLAFVLGLAFLLLLVTFRSIVIPLKAILLNLLSVGAAYGVVTWIFQEGNLESLLGFESTGGVTSWLPLFLFVLLFGLSMDYHVFILSRIREAYDNGMTTGDAVAHGIKSTASVVTAAAAVMIAVFSIFGTLSMVEFKQFGVGLGVAVLIDATIVRAVLLPATMKLLGDWNWYLPSWLEWLPRLQHEPQDELPADPFLEEPALEPEQARA
jgi:RND superfamily putative drug exporter